MSQQLAKKHDTLSLLKFALPTIIMLVVMSLYTIVDGIFVSHYVGTNALSAINIVYPFQSITVAAAIMLGTGGNAIVAKKLGEGKREQARKNFTLLVISGIIFGIIFCILGLIFLDPIIRLLGANESFAGYCRDYLFIILLFTPASVVQLLFQNFLVTEGKPAFGMVLTIAAGAANVVLDYLFMGVFHMGIQGAAWGTSFSYMIPAVFGMLYFCRKKTVLRFKATRFDRRILLQSCSNGSSEMVSQLSVGMITLLFNYMMLHYVGEDGVAAITVILYMQFSLTAAFIGFSNGIAPIISYNYGRQDLLQLKNLFKISTRTILTLSAAITLISMVFARQIVGCFLSGGTAAFDLTLRGFYIFSINYIAAGINIFGSAYYTALSDGKTSAFISFLRTFGLILLSALFLPKLLGVDGIWLMVPFAEFITTAIVFYLFSHKKGYEIKEAPSFTESSLNKKSTLNAE